MDKRNEQILTKERIKEMFNEMGIQPTEGSSIVINKDWSKILARETMKTIYLNDICRNTLIEKEENNA